ncbi:unnamed protein product [Penicillium salamii]|uniref:Xylanolytic transcriptional activator regulatory domain-containing protein n=1 Tax=Penicillium salamii TaxID=1612424 RepID=A0A9W4NPU2_9EURO|nr:unnamed protein product [Penicillium salamii]CAG8126697.1 unnamed protein product [Penicillium salamii]CAG8141930.1 unnamed protein product [Penicillium salamii]CAG8261087.1 unnamed protein product [Penicillium salamii]CAG8291667.1 unnamed protein product [Penicillium salamii]
MTDHNSSVDWSKWLPDYAGPLACSITPEDCNVLSNEGAFRVPDTEARGKILNAYVQFVHPSLPILNLEDFMMVVDKSYTGCQGISFLLFQAVIFAATAFQTTSDLSQQGFKNRKEARRTRFNRLKLLLYYDCESDRICMLQTFLLMTLWDETSNHAEDAWHFMGLAKATLNSIRKSPTDSERKFMRQQTGLWSRISWSCYIRDRLVCVQTRRPFQLENDLEIETLQPSDFEVGPLSTKGCLGSDGSHPAMRDPSIRSVLSQVSISLLQCCQCITRIVECQYTTFRNPSRSSNTSGTHLVPKDSFATSAAILLRDAELEEWVRNQPKALRWKFDFDNSDSKLNKHKEVLIHFRSLLSGIYSLACSALHRPQLSIAESRLPEMMQLSRKRLVGSAILVTDIYKYLRSQSIDHPLTDTQVAILETALVTFMGDLESTDSPTRQLAMEGFQSCAKGLQRLSETFPSAASSLGSIDVVIRKRKLRPHNTHARFNQELDGYEPIHQDPAAIRLNENDHFETPSTPSIGQQLDNLKFPQMTKLLYSHFMMTASEKTMLQSLASSEAASSQSPDDDNLLSDGERYDSSAPECISHKFQSLEAQKPLQIGSPTEDPAIRSSINLCYFESLQNDWDLSASFPIPRPWD